MFIKQQLRKLSSPRNSWDRKCYLYSGSNNELEPMVYCEAIFVAGQKSNYYSNETPYSELNSSNSD